MKKLIQESIQEAVQKAWSDAVSSLQGFEEDLERRLKQTMDRADLSSEEIQKQLADFGRKLQQRREAAGNFIEENVRSVLTRVRAPLMEELLTLKTQAEQIGHRIESQLRRRRAQDSAADAAKSDDPPEPPAK